MCSVLPVAELLGQVDVQDVRQYGDKLRGIAEGSTDGVSWVNVVQLCRNKRAAFSSRPDFSSELVHKVNFCSMLWYTFSLNLHI